MIDSGTGDSEVDAEPDPEPEPEPEPEAECGDCGVCLELANGECHTGWTHDTEEECLGRGREYAWCAPEDSCSVAVDLNEESSPVSGTLIGHGDAFTLACASGDDGPERVYSLDVPAGYNLQIGMSENDFDSRHELRFGGDCPGTELVQCIDDPDDTEMSFQNDGEDNQVVFFVVGAYSSPGGFTVAWELTPLRGEVREVSFPDADADATLVNVEVHIRTTSWANEISWNIDGIGDLTFDGLADRQDYYVSPVQTL